MSLLPAYFGFRRRDDDAAPHPEPEGDSSRDDVFRLIPPRAEAAEPAPPLQRAQPEPPPAQPDQPAANPGRNVHPVGPMDLSRLSIDNDGRLYWDGKPVEVRRSLMMSRTQVIGTSLIAAFIVMGAIGAAINGAFALHEWGCKVGWFDACGLPAPPPPPPPPQRFDIPA